MVNMTVNTGNSSFIAIWLWGLGVVIGSKVGCGVGVIVHCPVTSVDPVT